MVRESGGLISVDVVLKGDGILLDPLVVVNGSYAVEEDLVSVTMVVDRNHRVRAEHALERDAFFRTPGACLGLAVEHDDVVVWAEAHVQQDVLAGTDEVDGGEALAGFAQAGGLDVGNVLGLEFLNVDGLAGWEEEEGRHCCCWTCRLAAVCTQRARRMPYLETWLREK